MSNEYILALDQGTTSSRAILFDVNGQPVAVGQREFTQYYPKPGWVEHDPEEIWFSQWSAIQDCLKNAKVDAGQIKAIGITNQRETTIMWDKETGKAVHNAIVWQCRRTAEYCDRLREQGYQEVFQQKTGLILDAYFSGTKVAWLLDQVSGLRERAERGEICFGTVDSWLIYKLTGGQTHVTDYSNASRTMMFNIHSLQWDPELLQILNIPESVCPQVVDSSAVVAHTTIDLFGREIPIAGIAGDQQAALFGQGCYSPGMAKNTYGTGSFLLMNTGKEPVPSKNGLVTTIAWGIDGQVEYALEGSLFVSGAVVQWLRDELRIIGQAAETEALALSVPDTGDVYLVPAFVGLGAPYWDSYARGTIVGITRGTNRAHLSRAALESIAYQTRDVLSAMIQDSGKTVDVLRVDGGAINNAFLAQFQADILGCRVERPAVTETTAMGAAFLAGLAVGLWPDRDALSKTLAVEATFSPQISEADRDALYGRWQQAVERSRDWVQREGGGRPR
ncbi:glycerol kinase GlpK [Sulfobacillus harzensis]|uniref:Glycerol kinase n=1 Tax=Sulfobacillus harzensis TaxID=2729629 RepID=A0A7Y0L406_9FIRM|nr:glycerol kinase GlpK [Sulfobacillus harzensis]NMP22256.1 glycerol kinase GlpK [Sulfobacillus harzensis]